MVDAPKVRMEIIARAVAAGHYAKKGHRGQRLSVLIEKNWTRFLAEANMVDEALLQAGLLNGKVV